MLQKINIYQYTYCYVCEEEEKKIKHEDLKKNIFYFILYKNDFFENKTSLLKEIHININTFLKINIVFGKFGKRNSFIVFYLILFSPFFLY